MPQPLSGEVGTATDLLGPNSLFCQHHLVFLCHLVSSCSGEASENHVIAVLPTGSSKQSEYEIIEEQNCLYLGSTLPTVTSLLYSQFFTPKHISHSDLCLKRSRDFSSKFPRKQFLKTKNMTQFWLWAFGPQGAVCKCLLSGSRMHVTRAQMLLLLMSHLRFFRIKAQGLQSEIWNSFSLLSDTETHTNIPLVLSYFAEHIGWNSFTEFYIVPQLKKCLSS